MQTRLAIMVLVGTWLTAATILLAGSYVTGNLIAGLVAALLAVVTGLVWFVLVVVEVAGRRLRLAVTATVLAVLMIGGSAGASRIELPLLARFAASRSAFDAVIAERGEAGPGAVCPGWIGSYRIGSCRTVDSATYFTERDGGFLNSVGFAYLPEGPDGVPSSGPSTTYGQLQGPWYWFVEAW